MRFVYSRQDMPDLSRAQENCYLLTNGLGGYSALSAAFSMTRADQGFLVLGPVERREIEGWVNAWNDR